MAYRQRMRLSRLAPLTGLLAASLALAMTATTHQASAPDLALAHGTPGTANPPVNTAGEFKWGHATWNDEFHGGLGGAWNTSHRAPTIQTQHGMLTLNGPGGTGGNTLWASFPNDHAVGRWDFSMRTRQYEHSGTPYTVVLELVPSDKSRLDCGRQNIVIGKFPIGSPRVGFDLRNAGKSFTASTNHGVNTEGFHTYALEVTKTRISWFMEGKVLRTERRPEALSGETFRIKVFLTAAPKGTRTNRGRVQFDWMRYYTLARPNAKSVAAPQPEMRDFVTTCGGTPAARP
jgi:hypothetical protein